jgi:hypothetical protein
MIELNTFGPITLVLLSLFNPAVIAVGYLMGRNADQWQKIIVAAFAASLAGFILFWIGTLTGVLVVNSSGGASGVVMLQFVFGLVWAALGYATRTR